jgi:hypothetical protein
MDRNTIQKILIGLFLLACIFIGLKTFNVPGLGLNENSAKPEVNTNVSSSRMTYGRFLRIFRNGMG